MSAIRRLPFVLALAILSACQTTDAPSGFEIEFGYPTLGAGPQPSAIVLSRGEEATAVSAALLAALQELSFGVVSPELQAGDPLPERKWIATDIVPLPATVVAEMSASNPRQPLPNDRQLGAAHRLQFAVRDGRIHVLDSVTLHQKGALSAGWAVYKGPYVNDVLRESLRRRMEAHLKAGPNS